VSAMLDQFDARQLTAIAEFLSRSTDLIYRHAALLRAERISAKSPTATSRPEPSTARAHR
jgi:hypothetical protein